MFAGEFGWNVLLGGFGVRSLWPDWVPSPRTPVAGAVTPDWFRCLQGCNSENPQSLCLLGESLTIKQNNCRQEYDFDLLKQGLPLIQHNQITFGLSMDSS